MRKRKLSKWLLIIVSFVIVSGGIAVITALYMKSRPIDITEANFPDKAFREEVSKQFDKDKNGQLSLEEISKATKLKLSGKKHFNSMVGIEKLEELRDIEGKEEVSVGDAHLFERVKKLETIHLQFRVKDEINICNLTNIKKVDVSVHNTHLCRFVRILNCPNLKEVKLEEYTIGDNVTVQVAKCASLSNVTLVGVGIGDISFEKCETLSKVDIEGSATKQVRFGEDLKALKKVKASYMEELQNIDFSRLSSLASVNLCAMDELKNICFADDCTVSRVVYESLPQFTNLSFVGLKSLKHVEIHNLEQLKILELCNNSQIAKIKMNNLPKLEKLKLENTSSLKELRIKKVPKLDVDFSQLRNLQKLRLENCEIGEIEDVSKLKELYIDKSTFPLIDFSQMHDLEKIIMLESTVKKNTKRENVFDFRNLSKIKKIEIDLKNEVGVRWGRHKYLKNLSCWRGIKGVEVLDLKCFPNVKNLDWNCGDLVALKNEKGNKIVDLNLAGNKLTGTWDLSKFPNLWRSIYLDNNKITRIIHSKEGPYTISCKKNKIKEIKIKRVQYIDCDPNVTIYTDKKTKLDAEFNYLDEFEYLNDKKLNIVYY